MIIIAIILLAMNQIYIIGKLNEMEIENNMMIETMSTIVEALTEDEYLKGYVENENI